MLEIAEHGIKVNSTFSEEKLREFMEELSSREAVPERKFVVWTGAGGKEMFEDSMQLHIYQRSAQDLYDQKDLTESQFVNLKQMLSAEDKESFELAKQIIDIKLQINE